MRAIYTFVLLCFALLIAACDPLVPYSASPVAVVITVQPTITIQPTATLTPTATRTLFPSPTPDFTATPTPFPCDEEQGEVIAFTDNRSPSVGENLRYNVYVPPCYFSSKKRFPYVILLHGLSYRETQWQDLGLDQALDQGIRLGVLAPMLVVMPYMGNIGQLNQFPPDNSYETVILEELIPAIDRDFCTWSDRTHRAIGGISRGGFWAFSIALRHPDLFGTIGGHSAFFPNDLVSIPPAYNPLELARNSSFIKDAALRIYLDNGAGDSSGPSQSEFSGRLTSRDIPHTYIIHPTGEHNNEYWSAHVTDYLSFYAAPWTRSYEELPGCAEPSP